MEVAGTGNGLRESSVAAEPSALGTPADVSCRLAFPHCRELLAGKDVLKAHVAEEHPASMTTTGSTTSLTPFSCSTEAEGLKMHISTALGGLLDRALNNVLERGQSPGLNQPTLRLLPMLAAHQIPSLTSMSSLTSQPRKVYNTELAKQVRQKLVPRPRNQTVLEGVRARVKVDGVSSSHPYACFYCNRRFEQQVIRNTHMVHTHENEIISKTKESSEQAKNKEDRDDVCNESRPCLTGSVATRRPGRPIRYRVTSGSSSPESSAVATPSALGTSICVPHRFTCPHCHQLLAGEDMLVAHVALEHQASMTTGSTMSTTPLSCSTEAEGLKTHISTALGGLLDRALNNFLKKGLNPGFERQGTWNAHMVCTHKNEIIFCKTKQSMKQPENEEGSDNMCCELKPPVMVSVSSKCPGGSTSWPVTSGMEVAGTTSGSSESYAAMPALALSNPTNVSHRLACPHCHELLVGEDALVAHIVLEHPIGMPMTGSAASTTPLSCSTKADGLKTHISMAFGGLLNRALNNMLERGQSPGFEQHSIRNMHMVHTHKDKITSSHTKQSSKLVKDEEDWDDVCSGEDSSHNCSINSSTPQEVLAHCKSEHSQPELPLMEPSPALSQTHNDCSKGATGAFQVAPMSTCMECAATLGQDAQFVFSLPLESEFVALKHEPEDNTEASGSALVEEFEFVEVKQEEADDGEHLLPQERDPLETAPYTTQLVHSPEQYSTTETKNSQSTDYTEHMKCIVDLKHCGHLCGESSSPEEDVTSSGHKSCSFHGKSFTQSKDLKHPLCIHTSE